MRVTCDRPGQITFSSSLSSLHQSAVCRAIDAGTILIEGGVAQPTPQIASRMKWQGRVCVQAEGGTLRNVDNSSGLSVALKRPTR